MSEDIQMILFSYLFQWITLILLLIVAKNKRKILLINLGVQIVYTLFFYINFVNSGPGGGILAIIVFWIIFNEIHWFSTLIHLTIILVKRSVTNSLPQKVYDTVFFIYVLESILISLGIITGAISYGVDIGAEIMQATVIIALSCFILVKILIPKLNSKPKKIVGIVLSIIMLILCIYYPLEDHFEMF